MTKCRHSLVVKRFIGNELSVGPIPTVGSPEVSLAFTASLRYNTFLWRKKEIIEQH